MGQAGLVIKLLAIIRHEYLKRVRSLGFILTTVLGPLLLAATIVIPVLIAFIQPAPPRVVVFDQSGQIFEALQTTIAERRGWAMSSGNGGRQLHSGGEFSAPLNDSSLQYRLEKVDFSGSSLEASKSELTRRVNQGQIDAFVIIPADVLASGTVEYYGRSSGDPISNEQFDDYIRRAIIEQRLARAGINRIQLREFTAGINTRRIQVTVAGEERATGTAFFQIMGVGLLLFITVISYGATMLAAVTQDKESRLAELLFSSVKSFTLLLGKLLGVSLVAFTQYAIWLGAFAIFSVFGAALLGAGGLPVEPISIPVSFYVYIMCFFLLGYFIFATINAVVGAIMPTQDDSTSLALLTTFPLLIAFSMSMPVMRSPNSWMATIASFIPFLSPILMPIRIIAQTPPFWQIAFSLMFGVVTIIALLWLAARVYHVGMLMYGKKATVPEVMRWVRQAHH